VQTPRIALAFSEELCPFGQARDLDVAFVLATVLTKGHANDGQDLVSVEQLRVTDRALELATLVLEERQRTMVEASSSVGLAHDALEGAPAAASSSARVKSAPARSPHGLQKA
jgi:hypothetical protein